MADHFPAHYEGTSGTLTIDSPKHGIFIVTIEGHDVGEFGSKPMRQIENFLPDAESAELFIDARRTRGVSIDVSSEWAQWLGSNRACFKKINMISGSRFIQITAEFVRDFSDLHGLMCIYSDADAFDEALLASISDAEGD